MSAYFPCRECEHKLQLKNDDPVSALLNDKGFPLCERKLSFSVERGDNEVTPSGAPLWKNTECYRILPWACSGQEASCLEYLDGTDDGYFPREIRRAPRKIEVSGAIITP